MIEKNLAFSQKGNPYLSLRLSDKTGSIDGRIWDRAQECSETFQKGNIVAVDARALKYKDVIQLSILDIVPLRDNEIDPMDYLPSSKEDASSMFKRLLAFIDSIDDPHLQALLQSIFRDETVASAFMRSPAAKGFHHSYIGGLLEHTLSMVILLDVVANHYKGVNRDLLLAGGILHDIGKIEELACKRMIDYTDVGRLIGHIVLAVEMIDKRIADIVDFPEKLAMELRHIILSHHGILEYGSPKRPKTVEALIVNFVDDMDAKVNAFQEFIKDSGDDSNWTGFHRLLERFIYKGGGTADRRNDLADAFEESGLDRRE
ncbi:MAG: HD domain-containing protein [Deltaproteobacteria bacterium]|nr:HD domain-containing protein [Deltaproteobacteria bacterium]